MYRRMHGGIRYKWSCTGGHTDTSFLACPSPSEWSGSGVGRFDFKGKTFEEKRNEDYIKDRYIDGCKEI